MIALFVASATPARADLIVTVDNSTASPGGTGSFDVVLSSTGGTFGVGGFSVELAIASNSGIRFTAVDANTTAAPYIFGTLQSTPFSFNTFPTTDFIASDADMAAPGFVNVTPTNSFGLEHVSYSVAPGTALGPVAVTIRGTTGPAFTTEIDDVNGVPFTITPVNGSITVTGSSVPEPSSLLLMTLGLLAGGAGMALARRTVARGSFAGLA